MENIKCQEKEAYKFNESLNKKSFIHRQSQSEGMTSEKGSAEQVRTGHEDVQAVGAT